MVEESKVSGGGLAALAGQFGFDVGGLTGGGGVFSGDNVLLFLKSESLIREILFTPYPGDKKRTLADQYAVVENLKKKWNRNENIGWVEFGKYSEKQLPRQEDSLLQLIVLQIVKDDLSVSKPDKKASFIEVSMASKDEMLSNLFTERLVKTAAQHYVESKTRIKALNVEKLQKRADSLAVLLNYKTYTAATTQQNLIDVNPAMRITPIASEISAREKTMVATIFAEVVKNLELSKTILSQETPVFEIIDQSRFPLPTDRLKKSNSMILGFATGFILQILVLIFKKWLVRLKSLS